ncbi:MAG: PAS domain S-box protein [Promethearchaeota archaeon]
MNESEILYKDIFNSSPFLIGLINKEGILININDKVKDFLSIHTKQQIIGKNYIDILSLNEKNKPLIPIFKDYFEKIFKGEKQDSFEFKLYRSIEGYFWCRFDCSLVKIEEVEIIQFMVQNITEYKKIENNLRRSEDRFRSLFKGSPLFTIAWQKVDDDFILLDYNNTAVNMYGQVKDDLGITASEMFLKRQSRPDLFEELNRCFEEKSTFIKEKKIYVHFLNRERDFRIIWSYVPSDLVLTYLEDITGVKRQEQKLKTSEEKFRRLFKGALYFAVAWQKENDDFILFDYNEGAEKITKGQIKEYIGKSAFELFIKEQNRSDLLENLKKCFQEKTNFTVEQTQYLDFLNRDVDLRVKYTYVPPNLVLTHSEDITSRKKAEQQLKASEEKFRRLFKGSPYFTVAWQKKKDDFIIIDFNEGAEKLAVRETRDYMGKSAFEQFVKELNRPDLFENLKKCFQEKTNFTVELTQYINFLKRNVDFRVKYTYIPPNLVLANYEDITERKKAEQKLKESEAKFRSAFNNSAIAMTISTIEEGRIIEVNDVFLHDLGYQREEVIGKTSKELNLWVERSQRGLMMKTIKETGSIINAQSQYRTKTGELKYGLFSINKITINRKPYLLFIVNDITDRVANDIKLKESEKNLREAYNRAEFYKDLFAHDINNMLQSILSSNQLISMLSPSKVEKEKFGVFLDIISSEVNRGKKLVNSIKKLSLIEEKEILLEKVEILSILKKLIDKTKDSVNDKNLIIQIDCIKEQCYLQANKLIKDVFENIIINSIRHNKNENVEIIIRISSLKENGINYCKLEFIDNGIGIKDIRKSEIFYRASPERKKIYGIGLGLSLVNKIIEMYKGKIWVEDRVKGDYSKGSNFIILIPEVQING